MKSKDAAANMLSGVPIRKILIFSLPVFFGAVFQQLYNMVDSIVVGNYEGAAALAAVGSAATVCHCILMACSGFANGSSIVIAQQVGAQKNTDIKATISTTMIFLILLSLAVSVAFFPLSPLIAQLTNVPADIFTDCVLYMRIYAAGILFLMLYNFFAAVLRALGDSVTPLIFLVISSLLNIAGDLFCVICLGMGVAGVALATVFAQLISVLLCLVYVLRKSPYFHFAKGEFVFSYKMFRFVLQLGVPSALQSAVTNMGFIFMQSLVNSFSTMNIAAYTAASKMEGFFMLPVHSLSQGYTVFVAQNMGAGDIARTKHGLHQTVFVQILISAVCSLIAYALGPQLIGLFVDDAGVIERGTAYIRVFCPFLPIFAFMFVFATTLRGAGDSVMSMLISLCDLGMRVLAGYALSLWLGMGLMGCAWAIPIGWFSSAISGFVRYRQGKWQYMTVISKTDG